MLLTSSWTVDLLLIFAVFICLIYKYFTRHFDHWKKRGVTGPKPLPFFGNFYDTITFKKTIAHGLKDIYDESNEAYVGAFVFDTPVLIIRSPELIQNILIKDFSSFRDKSLASPQGNPIIANFLVFQRYEPWKKTRVKFTPIFTLGKLKSMFYVAKPIINVMDKYIKENIAVIDAKLLSVKFATEVITQCYFGFSGKCFDSESEILKGLYVFKPELVEFLNLNFMYPSDQDYMINMFLDVVESRKSTRQNNGKARDYIDIILDTKENNYITSESGLVEVMSNTLQFFIAGTETMSALQSFTLYELAIHPETQEKLRHEIEQNIEKYGDITYEGLQQMKYLECCLFETMRKYISLQIIDRKATEDYKVPGTNFVIEKGTVIYIPFYAIHNDENIYPEPDKYNPDRFEDMTVNENGLNFIPFGAGPRICLGERFAMIMTKLMLTSILLKYSLEPCDKTSIPIEIEPKSFTFQSKTGLPITFKPLDVT